MTREEARKLLGLPAHYTQRDIDAAYAERRAKYVSRSQYATKPSERDVATNALAIIQNAYHKLAGKSPSTSIKPPSAATKTTAATIPRASLVGTHSPSHAAQASHRQASGRPSASRTAGNSHASSNPKPSGQRKERIVGALIYCAICLIALFILGKGAGFVG